MAKELVIRHGFIIYADGIYSETMTGITTDLSISAQINELATADSIKSYVDASIVGGTIVDLSDTNISQPEQTGQTLVWDSGAWINTGISYFYNTLDSRYVNVDGDTMTGNLTLPGLTATTIDTTDLNATNVDSTNITGGTSYITNLVIGGTSINSIDTDVINDPGDNSTISTTSAITSYVQQELDAFSTTLSGLTDTDINNPLNGEILVYNGTDWFNTGISYFNSTLDNRYVNIDGDTMTGDLIMDTGSNITLNQGDITLSNGNLNITGNATIIGDLYVSGTTTTINTKDMNIADNIITLNSGETGSGVSLINSGIKIDRGSEDPYYFLFNESTLTFRIGVSTTDDTQSLVISGDTQAVATRENTPTPEGIAFWNDIEKRFDTNTALTFDYGTSTLNIDGDITVTGDVDGVDISEFYNEYNTFTGTTNTLENLNDTNIISPSVGEIIIYNGSDWLNTGISYFYNTLDSRYVNIDGDTMTGNLTLPGLTATTIDTTDLNATNVDSTNITGTTIYSTTINSTDIFSTNTNTDNLTLDSGVTVWSIQNSTGQTSGSNTLLTETAVLSLINSSIELSDLTDVTLTNLQVNDILIYTGSIWENTGQSYLDDLYVNVDGDTMTGDLTISTLSGTNDRLVYVDSTGQLKESDEYIYKVPVVSVGAGTTTIDTISTGVSYGSVWHYYIEDGTNYRSGIITSTWNSGTTEFNETSTNDIGDTTPVEFDMTISGSDVVLQSVVDSGTWNIKVVRMII